MEPSGFAGTTSSRTSSSHVTIERTFGPSWHPCPAWRVLVAWPLRPTQKFLVWITLFQIGSAVSRTFR
jgi:hypothetical protein